MKTIIHLFIWSIYICFPLYILPTSPEIISSNTALHLLTQKFYLYLLHLFLL